MHTCKISVYIWYYLPPLIALPPILRRTVQRHIGLSKMAWSSSSSSCMVVLLALAVSAQLGASALSPGYYSSTCPNLESIVRGVVAQRRDATIGTIGSTIRLFFHDCFVEVRTHGSPPRAASHPATVSRHVP